MLTAFDLIIFLKKYGNGFQLKRYPLSQDVEKFRSICEKYKMDFYPELPTPHPRGPPVPDPVLPTRPVILNMAREPRSCQLRIEGFFVLRTFSTKFCNISKYGRNLKLKIIVRIFSRILKLTAFNI